MVKRLLMYNKAYNVFIAFLFFGQIIFAQNFSYNFSGSVSYVSISNDNNNLNEPGAGITVECWIKPNESGQNEGAGIINYFSSTGANITSGFGIILHEGKFRFLVRTDAGNIDEGDYGNWPGIPLGDIPDDGRTWTHIAATYSAAEQLAKIYMNGRLYETSAASGASPTGNVYWDQIAGSTFYIARNPEGSYYNGVIDEIRYWQAEKTEQEISGSMLGTVDGGSIGLDGYWNFNDNQSTTVSDLSGNGNPGTLTAGTGSWNDDVFTEDCHDLELFATDFPFNHFVDFEALDENNDGWNMGLPSWAPVEWPNPDFEGSLLNAPGADQGRDYTYKLVLNEPDTVYFTSCDAQTTFDLQLGIFSGCLEQSLMYWQDDSRSNIYEPDTAYNYEFECISGIEGFPYYANMFPRLELEAGTYYFVVESFTGVIGGVRSWFGESLIVDSTSLSPDFSSIDYHFNQAVYGGEYPEVYNGNGIGLETSDFSINIQSNGGNATSASFPSITNLNGSALSGSETSITLNINYNNPPSGTEVANVRPTDEKSVFNVIGVPLLNIEGINFPLLDLVPPTSTITPTDGDTILPSDNLLISFSEQIYLIGGGNPDNNNIDDLFSLEYTDGLAPEDVPFDATINPSDLEITINPNSDFTELSTIRFTIQANSFQDQGGNIVPLTITSNLVADNTNPRVDSISTSISGDNSVIEIYFTEPVYTNPDDDPLVPNDFNINLTTTGNATSAWIATLANAANGNPLQGGEQGVRLGFQYDNLASGGEELSVSPAANQIYDDWGNQVTDLNETTYSLNDVLPPSVNFFSNNDQLFPYDSIFIIFSESVRYFDGSPVTKESIVERIKLSYSDQPNDSIEYEAEVNEAATIITLIPEQNFIEQKEVNVSFLANIFADQNDNILTESQSHTYTIRDITPPVTTGVILALANAYIIINLSEGVYTDIDEFGNGFGAVSQTDFTHDNFIQNNGTASDLTFTNVTDINGLVPIGGESSLKLFFTCDTLPSGVESVTIEPEALSIFDQGGNALEFSQQFNLYDQVSPSVSIAPVTDPRLPGFIYNTDSIKLDYSEKLVTTDNLNPGLSDFQELINLSYVDGNQENIQFVLSTLNITDTKVSLYVVPEDSLLEWRLIEINVSPGLQDAGGNQAQGGQKSFQVDDRTEPSLNNIVELDQSNAFIKIIASEGLYSTRNESGGLGAGNFEIISFNQNGGNANSITINSVTNFTGQPLEGGESEIRLNISTDTLASGVEAYSFGPSLADSIYDRAGNEMVQAGNTIDTVLFDLLPPLATFTPSSGATVLPTDTFTISFSESIRLINNSDDITVADIKNLVSMNYSFPIDTIIDFTPSINSSLTQIYLNPDLSLLEQASLSISFISGFEDSNDNAVDAMTAVYTVADITSPTFDSSSFSSGNRYISIVMSEAVWGLDDEGELIGLGVNDFNLSFNPGGGEAENVTIESVTNTSGVLLEGGENIIQINLNVLGSPTGTESIQIGAFSNNIVDLSGNIMEPGQFTPVYNLAPAPTIISSELSLDNSYVQLNFSENIFSSFDNDPIGLQDFQLVFQNNGGFCDTLVRVSITDTNNVEINSGEDTLRINFSSDTIIASGIESFIINVAGDEPSVFNESGVYMDPEASVGPFVLYDLLLPTYELNIDGQDAVAGDTIPIITFSEPIRNLDNSSIDNSNVDNRFSLYNLTDSIEVLFNASINEAKTEITVAPLDTFLSEHIIRLNMDSNFEDLADNRVQSATELIFTIRDYIDPDFDSLVLSEDNSVLSIYFTDQIFSSDNQTGSPEIDDFNLEFFSNDGNATSAEATLIQGLNGTSLIGGESSMKFIMEYNESPSGQEYILISPSSGNSLFDESGNAMAVSSKSDRIYLYDQLIPTIDTIDVWQGDYLAITQQNEIKLEFSEPLKKFEANLFSRKDPSGFTYTVDSTHFPDSVIYMVNAPLMSLDTIDLIIDRIEDSSGLSTVEISYRFLTPAMGDYTIPPNDTINLFDLDIFVEAWETGDFTKELGPVIGEYPHFKLSPNAGDGKFDLDDGMVFTRMWYWSLLRFGISEIPRYLTGARPNISFSDNQLIINPPLGSKAGQIILSYNGQAYGLTLKNSSPNKSGLFLNSGQSIEDRILIEYSSYKEEIFPIEFDLAKNNNHHEPNILLTYSFMDKDQNFISQGDSIFQVVIIPDKIALYQNFPNPFNPRTRIKFDLPISTRASINVFNINGRLIKTLADRDFDAGTHFVDWAGEDEFNMSVSSGLYFYQIISGEYVKSFKMLLIK